MNLAQVRKLKSTDLTKTHATGLNSLKMKIFITKLQVFHLPEIYYMQEQVLDSAGKLTLIQSNVNITASKTCTFKHSVNNSNSLVESDMT